MTPQQHYTSCLHPSHRMELKNNKFVCAIRFLFLRVVHDLRPQRRHRRISDHQRPDLQVDQNSDLLSRMLLFNRFNFFDLCCVSVLLTIDVFLIVSAGMCTIKVAWRPPVTSPSPFLPPSCQSCPPSIHRTSSSPTASGTARRRALKITSTSLAAVVHL